MTWSRKNFQCAVIAFLISCFSDVECFTGAAQSGVLSFLREGEDCEATAQRLADCGIAVRAGLHCAPLAHESAGTLLSGTVRLSLSAMNREEESKAFLQTLKNF